MLRYARRALIIRVISSSLSIYTPTVSACRYPVLGVRYGRTNPKNPRRSNNDIEPARAPDVGRRLEIRASSFG